jgi:OOP family OmpA-OmpF porin
MSSLRTLGLALIIVSAAAASVAGAGDKSQTTSTNKIIYDLTTPWPFRHAKTDAVKPGDADGDGVADAKDTCPGTPAGAIVDMNGCPKDSDGDGVPDGLDRCDGTPRGVKVDAKGCPLDSDGDGVADGLDRCEKTPKGARVDGNGCPIDSDGDGVADGIDQCPDTNEELAVDKKGCPIPVNDVAQAFLDAKSVSMNVQFASAKADIMDASEADLRKVGEVLTDWPDAKVEIAGHTDSQGSEKYNQTLSEKRAASVKAWLLAKYPKVKASNLTTKGYGESKPLVSNNTAEGMAKNRRVTFTLTNAKEISKDVETRRFKKRGE